MGIKKQPDSDEPPVQETANLWFQQFLKHLEIALAEAAQDVSQDAGVGDHAVAAISAVKNTLLASGLNEEQVTGLLGRLAVESSEARQDLEWNDELNQRRFELIDADIQGTLSPAEQLELTGLTQLMRGSVDSEQNVPVAGAQRLHRRLLDSESDASDNVP